MNRAVLLIRAAFERPDDTGPEELVRQRGLLRKQSIKVVFAASSEKIGSNQSTLNTMERTSDKS